MRASTYPSKRDGWLVAVIWVAAAFMAATTAGILLAEAPLVNRLVFVAAGLAVIGFMLWVLYGTRYTLTDKELIVRSGPLRYAIPLAEIRSVAPTRSPLSSPACSLDRLRVDTKTSANGLMISPAAKDAFLRDLVGRERGLVLEGIVVVRKDTW